MLTSVIFDFRLYPTTGKIMTPNDHSAEPVLGSYRPHATSMMVRSKKNRYFCDHRKCPNLPSINFLPGVDDNGILQKDNAQLVMCEPGAWASQLPSPHKGLSLTRARLSNGGTLLWANLKILSLRIWNACRHVRRIIRAAIRVAGKNSVWATLIF